MFLVFPNRSSPKQREKNLGVYSTIQLVQLARDVTSESFHISPVTIEGRGINVEYNKTCFFKNKYYRERQYHRYVWLFGDIERRSGRCFLKAVGCRASSALLQIVT